MFIPVIAIIIGYLKFNKELVWWEYLLMFIVPFILVGSMTYIIHHTLPESTSANNYYSESVSYEEPWDEWIHKTCSYTTCSGGKVKTCRTHYYDCSYRKYHEPEWYMTLNSGSNQSISQSLFNTKCSTWKNKSFVDMNRHYYTIDGDKYVCNWNKDTNEVITYSEPYSYDNKLLLSKNILGFRKLDSLETLKVYNNPSDAFSETTEFPFIVGSNDKEAYKYLSGKNGILGSKYQLTMLLMVHHNKPTSICELEETFLMKGKKNELILCINEKDSNIVSSKVISWTPNELLKIKIRDSINYSGKYNTLEAVKIMSHFTEKMWIRKNFHDFDYIEVENPLTGFHYVIIFIIIAFVTGGLSWYFISNEQKNYEEPTNKYYRRY